MELRPRKPNTLLIELSSLSESLTDLIPALMSGSRRSAMTGMRMTKRKPMQYLMKRKVKLSSVRYTSATYMCTGYVVTKASVKQAMMPQPGPFFRLEREERTSHGRVV